MKCGRDVLAEARTSAAVGFLKEKCSEEKGRFTPLSPPPLSTREKENQSPAGNARYHTNTPKNFSGNIQRIFHVRVPCSREKVYSPFVRRWRNPGVCFHRSQQILTERYAPCERLGETIYTGYPINLLDAWICCSLWHLTFVLHSQALADLGILLSRLPLLQDFTACTIWLSRAAFRDKTTQHSFQFGCQAGQSWPKVTLLWFAPLDSFLPCTQHCSLALIKEAFEAFQRDDSNHQEI